MDTKWTENAKVNDFVLVRGRNTEYITKIVRITKTMIIVIGPNNTEKRYNKSNGSSVSSSSFYYSHIDKPTEADYERIGIKNKIAKIKRQIESLDLNKLNAVELNSLQLFLQSLEKKEETENVA